MNGRVYDPVLGRFISADPHIQANSLSQSYNRYSYVLNNPLKYTDPSGYFFKKLARGIRKAGRKLRKAAQKLYQATFGKIYRELARTPWLNALANIAACATAWGCAAFSFHSNYSTTGDFRGSVKAGAIAYATAEASEFIGGQTDWTRVQKAVVHGAVGGTASVLQGGKFGEGFASSFFTKMVSGPTGIKGLTGGNKFLGAALAALVGGTASELGGGKFSNGARTAAIQYLYNEMGDEDNDGIPDIIDGDSTHNMTLNPFGDVSPDRHLESMGPGGGAFGKLTVNKAQAANIQRFKKKIPANSKDTLQVRELPGGGMSVQATSAGRVPGSKAIYEKQIDINGRTTQATKTTYAPNGNIVHVKDKLNGRTYP